MWRNFHEDWERRKAYLIRSLFQDIPLLSPVPENDESRQSSRSPLPEPPRDVAPARPESPLPPLIIERMPNRHDEPPEFYRELEKKIKKIYKKLFYGEEDEELLNSDDLERSFNDIEMENDDQGTEPTTITSLPYERDRSDYVIAHEEKITSQASQSESDDLEHSFNDIEMEIDDQDAESTTSSLPYERYRSDYVKAHKEKITCQTSQSESTSKSPSHDYDDSDVIDKYLRYGEGDAAIAEKSDDTSSTVNGDIGDTKITAEVVVHEAYKATEEEIEDVQVGHEELSKCTSPIIVLKTRLIQGQIQELHQHTENLTSHNHNKSYLEQDDEEVSQDGSCSNDAAIAEKSDDTSSTVNADIGDPKITAEVVVHEANKVFEEEEDIEDEQDSHEDLNNTSPILLSKTKLIQDQIQEFHQDTENLSSHNKSDSEQEDEEVSQDESCSNDAVIPEKSNDTSSTVNGDIGDTQITAEVVVHETNKAIEEEEHIEDVQERHEDLNKCTSPILMSKTKLIQDQIQQLHQDTENLSSHNKSDSEQEDEEVSQDESCSNDAAIAEKSDDTSSNVNGDNGDIQISAEVVVHEANKSIEEEENIEDVQERHEDLNKCTSPIIMDEEVTQDESCSNETDLNVSHRSVELMRRQEIISPSLGSLQDDLDETTRSEKSRRSTEISGFKRKTSFALHEEEEFWVQHGAARELSRSGEIAHDFHNLSTVMSPVSHFYFNRSSTASEYVNEAASLSIGCNNTGAKRSKYENVGVQTIEEDNENIINWDSLKSIFFVGTPKIFKLCSCRGHKCERH